jgi:hypothetical protein
MDAVRRHAAACPRCNSALSEAEAMDSMWARLSEPAAPAGLASVISARIARLETEGIAQIHATSTRRDPTAWAAAATGAALGVGAQLYLLLSSQSPLDLAAAWSSRWIAWLVAPEISLLALGGVLLYLNGFFALARTSDRSSAGSGAPD